MAFLDRALEGKAWLMGDGYSVADIYCGSILNWTRPAKYDLGDHPNIAAYYDRFRARDAVAAAREAEG